MLHLVGKLPCGFGPVMPVVRPLATISVGKIMSRGYKRKISILAFVAVLCLAVNSHAAELTGTVKSISGKPLAGVFIFPNRSLNDIVETDNKGGFSLPRHGKVICFRGVGVRPLTRIVDETISTLDVVLEEAAATQLGLPDCSRERIPGKYLGQSLRLPIPQGAEFHEGFDVDYGYFSIGYISEKNRIWIEGIYGTMATIGIPPEEWILEAKEFTERSYTGAGTGADIRGRTKDGKYWRYIGGLGESIEYSGVTEDGAAFFDKIIDSACRNR